MSFDNLKKFIIGKLTNELSDKLTYHGVHHTLAVLNVCEQYAKRMKIAENSKRLLFTAALIHDLGFLKTYDEHEEASIVFAHEILPKWNFYEQEITIIEGLIRATKIPQNPKNQLEQILADADLDYLGTDLFYPVGDTLYNELVAFKKISNRKQWNTVQISFLKKHHYHTTHAKKFREPIKQKHLNELIKISDTL